MVVGFVGTYQQLYRDLGPVVREASVFREAVGGPDVLGAKIGAVEGWSSAVWRKPNRGAQVYRWVGEDPV